MADISAGEGLSPETMAILDEAAASLRALRVPWIIGGDWNLEPPALMESGWIDMVDGLLVALELATCNGRVYDYFVICKSLAHAVVGIQRTEDAGVCPHFPSRLLLRGDARRHLVRQLVRPELVPATLPQGPFPSSVRSFPTESVRTWRALAWLPKYGMALPDANGDHSSES